MVMAAGALAGAAAGCDTGVDGAAEADRAVSIATTHGGRSGDEIVLPVDAYDYTVPERDRLARARDILIGECMHRFGKGYVTTAFAAEDSRGARIDLEDHGFYGNKRRYSVTDPAAAMKYGYHLVSTVTETPASASVSSVRDLDAAARAVLLGVGRDGEPVTRSAAQGRIPSGGCVGATDVKLAAVGPVGEARPVSELANDSYHQSLDNPKVTEAFQAWSACMSGMGYRFPTPVDVTAGFNLGTKTVSSREIATARADVLCKQRTHLVDIWFGAEVEYQRRFIQRHADDFRKIKTAHDAMMRLITKIISSRR